MKWLFLLIGLAAGAALALYFVCPRLCESRVRGTIGGWLDRVGISPSNPIRGVVSAIL